MNNLIELPSGVFIDLKSIDFISIEGRYILRKASDKMVSLSERDFNALIQKIKEIQKDYAEYRGEL